MQYGSNEERYDLYSDMFTDLLRGHHDGDARIETIRANLMIDIRWPEVSRALADVVRVHRAVSERLRPKFSDEQDLVRAAVDAIPTSPPVLTDLGPTILFLPQRLSSGPGGSRSAGADAHG